MASDIKSIDVALKNSILQNTLKYYNLTKCNVQMFKIVITCDACLVLRFYLLMFPALWLGGQQTILLLGKIKVLF